MIFFKKTLFLTLLSCSILESWAIPTEEFTKKTKFLLDQIVSKSSILYIEKEDIDKILNFLQTQWKKKIPDQKEFLKLMHNQPLFLEELIKCSGEHLEEDAQEVLQKGLNAYRHFKHNPNPSLDILRVCLSETKGKNQESFLNSPIAKKST